jgi:hypothetical protein
MTTTVTTAEAIRTALAATTDGVFSEKATNLLAALGYGSDHVPPGQPASVADFIAKYPAPNPGTQSENTCESRLESIVECWGYDYVIDRADDFVSPPGGSFKSISNPCGIRTDGSITCWFGDWNGMTPAPEWPQVGEEPQPAARG